MSLHSSAIIQPSISSALTRPPIWNGKWGCKTVVPKSDWPKSFPGIVFLQVLWLEGIQYHLRYEHLVNTKHFSLTWISSIYICSSEGNKCTPLLKIDKINIPNTGMSLVTLHLVSNLPLNISQLINLWFCGWVYSIKVVKSHFYQLGQSETNGRPWFWGRVDMNPFLWVKSSNRFFLGNLAVHHGSWFHHSRSSDPHLRET